MFAREQFIYDAEHDEYVCPNDKRLALKQLNVHDHEAAFERMQARLAAAPDMMARRRALVEHPYAGLKYWIMGHARLLMRGLEGAGTEMALAVNAYNLKRVINIVGVPALMEMMEMMA